MNDLLQMILDAQESDEELRERLAALEFQLPYENERVPRAQRALRERLQEMGDEAVPLLLEGLTEPRIDARLAIEALGDTSLAAARPLLDLLERGAPHEFTCRMALRRLRPPAAVLLEEIEAGRTKAAEIMGVAQGHQQALARLFVLLQGGTPPQQIAAATAIASAAHSLRAEHAAALGEALGSPEQGVSEAAAQALEGMGAAARGAAGALLQALSSGSAVARRAAAAALQKIGLEDATPLLARMDDPDEWVRQGVAKALVQGRHLAAVPALIEHLDRVHTERREPHLLDALVELAGDAAAPHLARWVHPRGVYREDCVSALGRVDAPVGVRALVELLGEAHLRQEAAGALVRIWKRALARADGDELVAAEVLAGGHPPTRHFLLRCAEEGPDEMASIALKITSVDWVRSIRSILVMAEHERTRRRAWELLEKHREHAQAALPWLIEQLALHDSSAPSEALKILSHWGPAAAPAVPALLDLLGRDIDGVSNPSVCWILEQMGPAAASAAEVVARYNPGHESYFGLPDVETAAGVFAAKLAGVSEDEAHLRAIKHLGPGARDVVPKILAGSFCPGVPLWVQREAVATLGALGGEEAERALIGLASEATSLREATVPALARLATPAAVLALGRLLGDPVARVAAAQALVRLPEHASAVLTELLADARARAAWEGPDAVVDALLRLVPVAPVP